MRRNQALKLAEQFAVEAKRLAEPQIGLLVIPTSEGPKVPVIGRMKGNEIFYDPPGGKPDPGEASQEACAREIWEEIGVKVTVGDLIKSGPHPFKKGLERHFLDVNYVSGNPFNKVQTEHLFMFLADPENAIELFKGRIPVEGEDYIRAKAEKISEMMRLEKLPQILSLQP